MKTTSSKKYNIIILLILIVSLASTYENYSYSLKHKKKYYKHSPTRILPTQKENLTPTSEQELIEKINQIISKYKLRSTKYSIAIYSLDQQRYYYSHNIEQPLVPASNTKLLLTFTALATLGTSYNVSTEVVTDGHIDSTGILYGNLYLIGRGDPLLSISDIENMAYKLQNKGIREIKGNIYYDDSFFDNKTNRIEYSGDKEVVQPVAPITALNIERNLFKVRIVAGSIKSQKPKIQIIPECSAVKVVNNAKIIQAKTAKRSRRGIKIQNIKESDTIQRIIINGQIPENQSATYFIEIYNPPLVTAHIFKNRLQSCGIKFSGAIDKTHCKEEIIASNKLTANHRSISDIIYLINKNSDNYLAEVLFKVLGAVSKLHEDNSISARKTIFRVFDSLNIPIQNCVINDGSGLSRNNKISTETLIQTLKTINNNINFKLLDSTLAIAGIDGTLKMRMKNTKAENNLRAKTGTHNNVSSLAGFLCSADGENFAFAMIFNTGHSGTFKVIEDKICTLIANINRNIKPEN